MQCHVVSWLLALLCVLCLASAGSPNFTDLARGLENSGSLIGRAQARHNNYTYAEVFSQMYYHLNEALALFIGKHPHDENSESPPV